MKMLSFLVALVALPRVRLACVFGALQFVGHEASVEILHGMSRRVRNLSSCGVVELVFFFFKCAGDG